LDDPEFTFRDDCDDNWFALWQSNLNIDLFGPVRRYQRPPFAQGFSTALEGRAINDLSHYSPRRRARPKILQWV
jgi:hypothetical protein